MGDVVMSDRPYSFDVQLFYTLEPPIQPPIHMKAGDEIRVECTYLHAIGETVGYGDSTSRRCASRVPTDTPRSASRSAFASNRIAHPGGIGSIRACRSTTTNGRSSTRCGGRS